MTEKDLNRKYLEITKKYLRTALDELGKIRGGIKLSMAIENAYWREIDDLPPLVAVEEVTVDKLLTQKVEVVKSKRPTKKSEAVSEQRGCSGPLGWRYVCKKGEKSRMVPKDQLKKYLNNGWVESSDLKWITNGKENKRIDSSELDYWEKQGWYLGKVRKNTEE